MIGMEENPGNSIEVLFQEIRSCKVTTDSRKAQFQTSPAFPEISGKRAGVSDTMRTV
jgi:hypothetical protein